MELPCIYSGIQGQKDISSDILKCVREIFQPLLHNDCIISVVILCQFWLHNVNIQYKSIFVLFEWYQKSESHADVLW